MNTYIGLIPARSGSKGIINKNLKKIEKLSLVEKAVKNLKSSKKIKDVFVSSDSQKILSKISKFGGIPFKRLKKFATDRTTGNDVIKNFISKKKLRINTILVYHQPTSPLKNNFHISKAIDIFEKKNPLALISCYKADSEVIFKSFVMNGNTIKPLFGLKKNLSNRQDIREVLVPNGAIFIFRLNKKFFKKGINFDKTIPYIMKKTDTIDINTITELNIARKILKPKLRYEKI